MGEVKILALDIDGEEWRPIPGFSGYEVSSFGRVRSHWWYATGLGRGARVRRKEGWLLKPVAGHAGHIRVFMGRGAQRGWQLVHRLVLYAFYGPCPDGMVCCHNNGMSDDNRPSNLRWDTPSANQRDSVKHGTHDPKRGTRQKHSVLTEDLVRQIRASENGISDTEWARKVGCSRALVYRVRKRQVWGWLT